MNKFKKLLKELLAKSFVSADEKAELKTLFGALSKDEQTDAKEETDDVLEKDEEQDETEAEVEKAIGGILDAKLKTEVDGLKKDITEYMKEQKEKIEKKIGLYEPSVAEKRKVINVKTRALCKSIISGVAMAKEMTTDDTGSPYAGYVVGEELSLEIRHLKTEYGTAAREFVPMQLSKNSYKANELVTDAITYWVDEAGSIKSTEVVLGQNTLELKKMAAIITLTSELIEDEELDLASFVASRVAEQMAQMEDDAFFNGDGTSAYGSFTGLLNSANVNAVAMAAGNTDFTDITPDDLLDMIDATPSGALKNAKFYMDRTIYTVVRKKKDSQGNYIFQAPYEGGVKNIDGYKIELVEVMPSTGDTAVSTPFVIFGDLKKGAIYGFKKGITAKRFDAGTVRNVANDADLNLITEDREAIRWTQRVGYMQTIQNGKLPITVLSTPAV